jgi:hypothetical protein
MTGGFMGVFFFFIPSVTWRAERGDREVMMVN